MNTPTETAHAVLDAHLHLELPAGNYDEADVLRLMVKAIDEYREQAGIEVQLWNAAHDGVRVVQIDTGEDGAGRLRINLNDGPVWDGDPETDERPGAQLKAEPRYTFGLGYDEDSTEVQGQQGAYLVDIWDNHGKAGSTLYVATMQEALAQLAGYVLAYPDHDEVDVPDEMRANIIAWTRGEREEPDDGR